MHFLQQPLITDVCTQSVPPLYNPSSKQRDRRWQKKLKNERGLARGAMANIKYCAWRCIYLAEAASQWLCFYNLFALVPNNLPELFFQGKLA
jgi:hypothetical protein